MLKEIYIKNLAVIREAVIPLSDNLNIFTGETGAGKSILINGINAVMGNRCSKDSVRTGCEKAVITALFTDLDSYIIQKLDELGISHENNEITLTREINSDGRSTARVNSKTSSASVLKEIGNLLINIHGQHDNQILLDSEKHMKILDSFGDVSELLQDYQESFRKLQASARRLGELKKVEYLKAERLRYLNTVIDEIGKKVSRFIGTGGHQGAETQSQPDKYSFHGLFKINDFIAYKDIASPEHTETEKTGEMNRNL